jgi:hypothetical protein
MQPYVDAVTAHAATRARPMLQNTCDLLTARHERERPRTRERAMLLMEKTVRASPATPARNCQADGATVSKERRAL